MNPRLPLPLALPLFAALLTMSPACGPARLDSFLYDPKPAPPGGYRLSTEVIPTHEDLFVPTVDGQTIHAAFIPSSGQRPDVTVVYFHGQSNNIGSSWPRMEVLYPLGTNLVIVDPRGYGLSTGTPTEAGIQLDEQAVRGYLATRADVDPARLVYYGRSFGAALAIDLATRTAPAALITESAFASVQALIADGAYVDLPRSFVADSAWDNLGKIGGVNAPYLALHGTADPYVLPRYSQALARAHEAGAPGVATVLVMVPGADHGNVPETMGLDAYREAVAGFIDAALPAN